LAATRAELAATRAELVETRAELEKLRAENVDLRARLGQNSQNSSRPPSSDLFKPRPAGGQGKSGKKKRRKRGAQPGHRAKFAPPPAHIDEVREFRAKTCQHCAGDLAGGRDTGTVVNHFVYELPDIRPHVCDNQCLDVECPHCGEITPATLPPEVPTGAYGPSVQAMNTMLRGELRQSVRQTSDVMTNVMHVPMSTGMVAKTQEQVSRVLAAPHQEALDFAHTYDRPHADETSWRQDKRKAWLWVAVCGLVTVFLVRLKRDALSAKALLGEKIRGLLTTDRFSAYGFLKPEQRQFCWSHLKRDFASFLDYGKQARQVGRSLLADTRRLFRLWHRVRHGTLSRVKFQERMAPIRQRILEQLAAGEALPVKKVPGMCKEILRLKEALFTFVDHEGLEPTNNSAERALRFVVLWRKGSFGSDAERGSRFVERFLTVRATLRAQHRDLYSYLKAACTAALHGAPIPSVLPVAADVPAEDLIAA
jgi:transposase